MYSIGDQFDIAIMERAASFRPLQSVMRIPHFLGGGGGSNRLSSSSSSSSSSSFPRLKADVVVGTGITRGAAEDSDDSIVVVVGGRAASGSVVEDDLGIPILPKNSGPINPSMFTQRWYLSNKLVASLPNTPFNISTPPG